MIAWTVPGYAEGRELGRGAAGVVRLATHDATGQPVAIKYLSDQLLADDGFRAGFRQEAELLGRIDAPNVVRLHEYVETSTGAAIVMELVDGLSLRAMLDQQGPTEPESALSVLKGALTGLGTAHALGIVHRDFKPENVLVDTSGQSKLTDFGIAARAGGGGAEGGTPLYMAPEQWRGTPPEPRGDIYSATATFVECLTGRPPFDAPSLDLLRQQHEQAPVPVEELPEPVRGLALRGMAKDPSQRPADAFAFVAELCLAAEAGYGEGWEERGREALAKRAALLAMLFPLLAGGLVGGTAIAMTRLGGGVTAVLQRNRAPLAVGIATVLAISGGVLAFAPATPQPRSVPVETAGTAGPPLAPVDAIPGPTGPVEVGLPPAQPALLPPPAQPAPPAVLPPPAQPAPPAVLPPPAGQEPIIIKRGDREPENTPEENHRSPEDENTHRPWSTDEKNGGKEKKPPPHIELPEPPKDPAPSEPPPVHRDTGDSGGSSGYPRETRETRRPIGPVDSGHGDSNTSGSYTSKDPSGSSNTSGSYTSRDPSGSSNTSGSYTSKDLDRSGAGKKLEPGSGSTGDSGLH
jgi:serine/threonine-protein kinase